MNKKSYQALARKLVSKHGRLNKVEFQTGYPNFEINFVFNRKTVLSGFRTGEHDIHFLRLGYSGQGPIAAREFLKECGFRMTMEQIDELSPGAVLTRENKQVVVNYTEKEAKPELCWHCKREMEERCIYRPEEELGRAVFVHNECWNELHRKRMAYLGVEQTVERNQNKKWWEFWK